MRLWKTGGCYDGRPNGCKARWKNICTNLEVYLRESVEVEPLDEPPDMEKLGQLKLVQQGFIELEGREDLKEGLKRIKSLVGRRGF